MTFGHGAVMIVCPQCDQPCPFEALHDVEGIGPVDAEFPAQAALVEPGLVPQNAEQAVLQGRDAELAAGLEEHRRMNLMQAAHQESRALPQQIPLQGVARGHLGCRFFRFGSSHVAASRCSMWQPRSIGRPRAGDAYKITESINALAIDHDCIRFDKMSHAARVRKLIKSESPSRQSTKATTCRRQCRSSCPRAK